ncbi:MAG: NADH-quinone oxidoreductase subunit NuoK [FCB group bacterium]|nr:NADH-quinone oxidoreductase subunit NuoK [FCB group bacterium]
MTVPLDYYIILSAFLFAVGAIGVIISRNLIVMFMSVEIMLNAGNLALVAFSRHLQQMDGHVFVFLVMTVAAAEAAVGLAIIIAVFRNRESVDSDALNLMKW